METKGRSDGGVADATMQQLIHLHVKRTIGNFSIRLYYSYVLQYLIAICNTEWKQLTLGQ